MGKTVPVTPRQILNAWQKVKASGGSGGVDGKSLSKVEQNLQKELYVLWNRMSSGSYFPKPVKAIDIPKWDGSKRQLGIPTIIDRVAQQVVKDVLESKLEKVFHKDSFGYRPNRGAHQAVEKCRLRCIQRAWVIDLDIKGFFDTIDHNLLQKALTKHTDQKWILMYVKRWLKSPMINARHEVQQRKVGTPQGGVISPVLANLFLHYAFDMWIEKYLPEVVFERYADDIVIHCKSFTQAKHTLQLVTKRMEQCKLKVHPGKTKIVYCKTHYRQLKYPVNSFEFLGFGFKPRKTKTKTGKVMLSFGPAIGKKASKHINSTFKKLKVHRATGNDLGHIAQQLAHKLRGWINYFGKYRIWSMDPVFKSLNQRLVKWLMNKFKRYRNKINLARKRLIVIAEEYPNLFVHWQYGFKPR